MKCRLLGWWADETKGYRLEDIETRGLITSRNVCFVEDISPTDEAVIEGIDPRPSKDIVGAAGPDAVDDTSKSLSMMDGGESVRVAYISIMERARKGPRKKHGKIVGKSHDCECRQIT